MTDNPAIKDNLDSGTIIEIPSANGTDGNVARDIAEVTTSSRDSINAIKMAPNENQLLPPSETATKEKKQNGAKGHRKPHEKPPEVVDFRTHLTSLAHISTLVFVYIVLKLAVSRGEFDFFTWHPILLAVGWMLLMTEGFYAINKYNTYWRLKTTGGLRVKVHVTVLALGYTLSVIGFAIVYINKENKGKHHFVSWHGLFGLIGLICTFPPVLNGLVLWYKKELASYIPSPKLVKFVHVMSGTLAFTFGALALVLSVYTNWWAKRSNRSDYWFYVGLLSVIYPLVWAVYGPAVKLTRVIKDYFSEDKDD
ncbi:probable transmembrane reductase CYB561D1 [Anthonomus grandis grandis]|uniref:probable transmembrane reductase CYB561D1 n=1 Tax=Anthonomus grandis grandis TaxID=2921223 RepID=UPI00216661E6|nr:probable transmembrane reductase CYB561D1 [Anthonomus grandis grandis]